MLPVYRLILVLMVIPSLITGCVSTAAPAPTVALVPTTNMPNTATPVPPTPTPPPATATSTPAQRPVSQVIGADNASRLEKVATLDLPQSFLNAILFTPDNLRMLTGDRNGEVLVWDRATWQKTRYLAPQSDLETDNAENVPYFGSLALTPDGKIIVTGDAAGAVTGRDAEGNVLFSVAMGERVYSTAISPDGKYLAAGGVGNRVIIINLATRQLETELSSDHEYVASLVFSPDGKTLWASYERPDNVMKIWDTTTWQETATFSHVTERIDYHDAVFAPTGESLAIASTQSAIKLLDVKTQQVIQEWVGHTRGAYQIAFSPDGTLLASASDDMTLRLWDVQTGKTVWVLKNRREVGTVAFSSDGTLLAFGVWGEGVQVWAVADAPASAPQATAAPAGGAQAISTATVSQVTLQTKLSGHTGRVFSVAFSSDGRLLASAGENEVKLWDLTTQQEIKSFKQKGDWRIFFLANDQQLASNNGKVWSIESGEIVHAAVTNRAQATFSSDGRWMALAPSNLPIELWNTATWQVERTLDKHSDAVIGMAFSADNTLLATGSAMGPDGIVDISIKLWDVANGRELFTLKGHNADIHGVAFSPDGSVLVSGGIDPTVKLWDVKSGTLIRSLQSGEGVMDVTFSPDGSLVASAGSDGTVKLWEVASGKLLKTLRHPDELMTVAFSPDGTLLVSGSYDQLIYLWGISK